MGPRKSAASNVTITVRSDSGEGHTPWWLEGIKLVPQLAWVVVGACLLVIFTGPLLRALEQGNITKLGIGVVQIDIAQKEIQRAQNERTKTDKKQEIPTALTARIERVPRALFDAAILWLDDNPANNLAERRALTSLGLTVDTATNTADALKMLSIGQYQVIISDISRNEPKGTCKAEDSDGTGGCDLIGHLNRRYEKENRGRTTERAQPPVIFYVRVHLPEKGAPPYSFGITSKVDELFHLVLDALERRDVKNYQPRS